MQYCPSCNTSIVVNILLLCMFFFFVCRVEGHLCIFFTSVIRLLFLLSDSLFYKGRGDYSNCLDMSRLFNL